MKRFRIPDVEEVVGRAGDRVFVRTLARKLAAIDLGTLPPTIQRAPIEFPLQVLRLDSKRWLVLSHDRSAKPARVPMSITADPLRGGRDAAPRWAGRGVRDVSIVDDIVYAHDIDAAKPQLLRWNKDTWTPVDGLPTAKSRLDVSFGTARTGNGSDVLIWNGDGYEHVGGRLKRTFSLGATEYEWSSVPAGATGFYYASKRSLWLAERGKKPRKIGAAKAVMQIAAGPDGSVLMKLGDNAKRWQIATLRDGKVTGFTSQTFGTQRDVLLHVMWSERAGCALLIACDAGLIAVPRESLRL